MSSSSPSREPSQALLVLTSERVPLTLPLETLQAALETLADDLMVELELRSEE